jgi:electron transport complex protein RnfB
VAADPAERRDKLVERIDQWLPQTQCTQCGYPRCLDYARALADGEADINQCPPGGDATIRGLAGVLGRSPKPLDPAFGTHRPRTVVRIDEARCIGCALCLDACPVDAIVGAAKRMHTVIEAECTGCELCLPPCPVDCIEVLPADRPELDGGPWRDYSLEQADRARRRTGARLERLDRRERERELASRHKQARTGGGGRLRAEIADAVSRVRGRRRLGATGRE